MLYSQKTAGFPLLSEALYDAGVPREYIDILPEYLNTESPRNDALLDNIQTKLYHINYMVSRKFSKAIKKELPDNKELLKRWYLYTYAVAGNTCNQIGFEPYSANIESMKTVLSERYGKEAEARYYAMMVAFCCNSTRSVSALLPLKIPSPEHCLAAVAFADTYHEKLALTLLLLSMCRPMEKGLKGLLSGQDPLLKSGLLILRALYQDNSNWRSYDQLALTTLAIAATLSNEWHKILSDNYPHERLSFAKYIMDSGIRNVEPVFDMLDTMSGREQDYIRYLAGLTQADRNFEKGTYFTARTLSTRDVHLKRMAEQHQEAFRQALERETETTAVKALADVYHAVYPDDTLPDMRRRAQKRVIESICIENEAYQPQITSYLNGTDSLETFLQIEPKLNKNINYWQFSNVEYVVAYGKDDFAERCICFHAIVNFKSMYCIKRGLGLDVREHLTETIDILNRHHIPLCSLLNFCGNLTVVDRKALINKLAERKDEIAAADPSQFCLEGRKLAIEILQKTKEFAALFAYANDASKEVRADLCNCLPLPGGDFDAQYRELLQSKKQSVRDVAVTMLEKHMPDSFREEVKTAYGKEKNAGLQNRFAVLLGEAAPKTEQEKEDTDLVQTLTKGGKPKKVEFLFTQPFAPVRKTDGEPADERTLKALAICYADAAPGRSQNASKLAAGLNAADTEIFVLDCFRRWLALGAPAKTKWVLYLTSIHGGMEAIAGLQRYIKEWSENARGAIAAEAVNALALNGSPVALMAVDAMARKFKNKQVRYAAGKALQDAADALGITREELADLIVPDLGFDENRCRIFDFGTRQFKVFINPALELEIYEGDKKLKNLPKPGAKDETEKAEAAVRDFKEMKKQMKTAIQTQTARLEYVLMCDRKWTAESWQALFVKKPVMHCFAIGLIWGVYEDGKLVQSFRYMEDGTFNTPDEDEYELPENAQIGLVHPMELDEELRLQWIEQLTDYEIKQPFPQLTRSIYLVTEEEKNATELTRFNDRELPGISLLGRMTKLGWDKGYAGDGGMFDEFERCDISGRSKDAEGNIHLKGFHVYLTFSGMDISGYDNTDNVSIEKVEFFDLNSSRYKTPLSLGKIPPRYFSEIVHQLNGAL